MLDGKACPEMKRKCYVRDTQGKVRLRVGPSVLDLGDGMTDIVTDDDNTLPKTIETVVAAVKGSGLDGRIGKALAGNKPPGKFTAGRHRIWSSRG